MLRKWSAKKSSSDLEIILVKETNVRRTYSFEIKREAKESKQLLNAVVFAREQLMQEIKRNGYNILLLERCVCYSLRLSI